MEEEEFSRSGRTGGCGCSSIPGMFLVSDQELGMDEYYADVSLLTCARCGKRWLRYFFEMEAYTASGRWYLGAINTDQAANLNSEDAKAILESLDWYFYGGSYYGGRSGRTSGRILLNP